MATESPMYFDAVSAIQKLQERGNTLHIVAQNLIEFWNVYTRPTERNGFGRTVAEAKAECDRLRQVFPLLLDTPDIYPTWEALVVRYGVIGVNVHDARLVAAMQVHRLTHILTFNRSDFQRYAEITAIAPIEVFG
jgi:predicted nucleic acid-binding protein